MESRFNFTATCRLIEKQGEKDFEKAQNNPKAIITPQTAAVKGPGEISVMCHPLIIIVLVCVSPYSHPLWGLNPPPCYRCGSSVALLSRTAAGAAPDGIFNGADGEDEFLQGFSRHLTAYCFLLFAPLPSHVPPLLPLGLAAITRTHGCLAQVFAETLTITL